MEIIAHLLGNVVNFLLLLTAVFAAAYVSFLAVVFGIYVKLERRFTLTPELWFGGAASLVYLLTCLVWRCMGF